jgi:hypothetical protein
MSPRTIFRKRAYNHKIEELQTQVYVLWIVVIGLAAVFGITQMTIS